jgi:hypothetical protein
MPKPLSNSAIVSDTRQCRQRKSLAVHHLAGGDLVPWEWLAPVATAVVGVAGITGTVRAASVSRRAQIEVARLAQVQALLIEKRTVYAEFLRTAEEIVSTINHRRILQKSLVKLKEEFAADAKRVQTEHFKERLDKLGTDVATAGQKYDVLGTSLRSLNQRIVVIGGPLIALMAAKVSVSALNGERADSTNALALAMHLDTDPNSELTDQSLKNLSETASASFPYTQKIIEN